MSGCTQDRFERLARNQSDFSDVNDRVDDLFGGDEPNWRVDAFLCECASAECVEHVTMTHAEYLRVRATATAFVVFPHESHVFPDVERVVARSDRYWIVETPGPSEPAADDDDSRRLIDPHVRWRFDWAFRA